MSLELSGLCTVGATASDTADPFTLDINLTANAGERATLIGPNGSGKSSVLRLIAGLEALRRGELTVAGRAYDSTGPGEPSKRFFLPPRERSVSLVFQDHRLFDHLSVEQNVAFGLEARGTTRAEIKRVTTHLLDAFDLGALSGRNPTSLSGGQRARVALARALAPSPAILLLDEPFAAVDVETRAHLQQALIDNTPPETATVMVTHDPIEARVLSHQLVVLDDGNVTQHGTPDQVASSPTTSFAADLLGTNLIAGSAHGTEVTLATGAKLITATSASGPVHLTFSPSAITLHQTKPQGSARNVWPAEIADFTDLGGRVRVALRGPVESAAMVTPGAVADLGLTRGTNCWASLKATEITVVAQQR